ncbi:hypothetical protein ASD62_05730 [Phycicoccus sp. Root563]|uniref:hypothetical protein n=1 Tax=Phycicoccus sp. Root563 TaxID=1736562 RepID=UPI0007030763|nr:hypothetical protein [Phycicoccus sp. Root563]KQZ88876.1 hypothetical protein ASD62_05730 [Phycicoccus sp. Root563]
MATVIIQPSFGNADARRHWQTTMEGPLTLQLIESLTTSERRALNAMHPDGLARFWGMTSNHDSQMDTIDTGDVVLFTGQKLIQGIGEIGVVLRSSPLGDELWDPHPERGSYNNVYSLKSFRATKVPYSEIWELPSFNVGDNFMGARFLRGDRAEEVLDGLKIRTSTEAESLEMLAEKQVTAAVEKFSFIVPDEALKVESSTHDQPARQMTVNRHEAQLVRLYREHLGVDTTRVRTRAGVTDMVLPFEGGLEVVEAKSSSSREAVRMALGQILDYCHHVADVRAATVLLPARPDSDLLELAARLGVGVTYPSGEGDFTRHDPSDQARKALVHILRA